MLSVLTASLVCSSGQEADGAVAMAWWFDEHPWSMSLVARIQYEGDWAVIDQLHIHHGTKHAITHPAHKQTVDQS
jgi:hypothetical protein